MTSGKSQAERLRSSHNSVQNTDCFRKTSNSQKIIRKSATFKIWSKTYRKTSTHLKKICLKDLGFAVMIVQDKKEAEELGAKKLDLKLTKVFETPKKNMIFKFLSQKNRSKRCRTATEVYYATEQKPSVKPIQYSGHLKPKMRKQTTYKMATMIKKCPTIARFSSFVHKNYRKKIEWLQEIGTRVLS